MVSKLFSALFTLVFIVAARAQQLDDILDSHYKAVNQEMWDQFHSTTIEGVQFVGQEKITFRLYAKKENRALKGSYNGEPYAEVISKTGNWQQLPWTGDKKVRNLDLENELILSKLFAFGSFIIEDRKLELRGEVRDGGLDLFKIVENRGISEQVEYYIDAEDYFLRKIIVRKVVDDETIPLTVLFDQYRNYGPFPVATSIVMQSQEGGREFVFDEFFLGDGIRDQVFARPD